MEETLIKRVLPHSIEAEQSVIGSMLMDKGSGNRCIGDHHGQRFLSATVRDHV